MPVFPFRVVILLRRLSSNDPRSEPFSQLLLDVGFAGQNMMLEATHLGLRTHGMGGWDEGKVKSAVGIPDDHNVCFLLVIGYGGNVDDLPEDVQPKENRERVRNDVGENCFDDKFGSSWEDR